jgi:hypothetical protein
VLAAVLEGVLAPGHSLVGHLVPGEALVVELLDEGEGGGVVPAWWGAGLPAA